MRAGWALWADWCLAVGRTSLNVTAEALDEHARQVSTARLSDIAATCRELTIPWPHENDRDPWQRVEAELRPLEECLEGCPSRGWPEGLRGRRDAWLLVLTRGLSLTRAEAVRVTVDDLDSIWDRLPHGASPASCHRCVMSRWLEVVDLNSCWSWWVTRERMLSAPSGGHDCDQGMVRPTYPVGPDALAPTIDRHGGLGMRPAPLTSRSVTGVIAARCRRLLTIDSQAVVMAPRPVGRFDETTIPRLDAACEAADVVNARIEALLDEAETALRDRL